MSLRREPTPLRRDINERAGKTALYTFWSTLVPYLIESYIGTFTHLSMLDRGIIFAFVATVFASLLSVGGSLLSTQLGAKGTASLTTAYDYRDAKPEAGPRPREES